MKLMQLKITQQKRVPTIAVVTAKMSALFAVGQPALILLPTKATPLL